MDASCGSVMSLGQRPPSWGAETGPRAGTLLALHSPGPELSTPTTPQERPWSPTGRNCTSRPCDSSPGATWGPTLSAQGRRANTQVLSLHVSFPLQNLTGHFTGSWGCKHSPLPSVPLQLLSRTSSIMTMASANLTAPPHPSSHRPLLSPRTGPSAIHSHSGLKKSHFFQEDLPGFFYPSLVSLHPTVRPPARAREGLSPPGKWGPSAGLGPRHPWRPALCPSRALLRGASPEHTSRPRPLQPFVSATIWWGFGHAGTHLETPASPSVHSQRPVCPLSELPPTGARRKAGLQC